MQGFMPMAASSPVPHMLPGGPPPPHPGGHHLPSGLEHPGPPGHPSTSLPLGLHPHHPGLDVRTLSPHQLHQLHQHEQVRIT